MSTTITTAQIVSAIAAYDKTIRTNYSPSWDTLALVAEDEFGEALWECLETATNAGIIPADADEDVHDAWADALSAPVAAYKEWLAREVAQRPAVRAAEVEAGLF
jgi:hypothetical protein